MMEQIEKWYKTDIEPILQNCGKYLQEAKPPLVVAEWWHIFQINSTTLFETMGRMNETYQFNTTMRLLVEMGADLDFISKNSSNIDRFGEQFEKLCGIVESNGGIIMYADLMRQMKEYRLKTDDGKNTKTMDRIRLAYDENFIEIYSYLSCYSHFNFCAVKLAVDLSVPGNEARLLQERLHIATLYPAALYVTMNALRKIVGIEKEVPYDLPTLSYYCGRKIVKSQIMDVQGNVGYKLMPLYKSARLNKVEDSRTTK